MPNACHFCRQTHIRFLFAVLYVVEHIQGKDVHCAEDDDQRRFEDQRCGEKGEEHDYENHML